MTPLCAAEALSTGAGRDCCVTTSSGTGDLDLTVSLGTTANGTDD